MRQKFQFEKDRSSSVVGKFLSFVQIQRASFFFWIFFLLGATVILSSFTRKMALQFWFFTQKVYKNVWNKKRETKLWKNWLVYKKALETNCNQTRRTILLFVLINLVAMFQLAASLKLLFIVFKGRDFRHFFADGGK